MKIRTKYIPLLIISVLLISCNKEIIMLKGEFKNLTNLESHIVVKVKSQSQLKEQILDTIELNEGKFEFYSNTIKPPMKLTFMLADSTEFEAWVGEYGTKTLEVKKDSLRDVKVIGSFFCDELQRMNTNLNKMYVQSVEWKEDQVFKLEELAKLEDLSDEDDMRIYALRKDIKKAYLCRKKSILKTVRKAPQNPVAVALMCQEYERLTSRQKQECLKYLSRSFSDTGLNWQMKH